MKRLSAVIWMVTGGLLAQCGLNPQPFPPNGAAADAGSSGPASQQDASAVDASLGSGRGTDASVDAPAHQLVDGAVADAIGPPPPEDGSPAADSSAEAGVDAAETSDAPIDGEGADADADADSGAADAAPEAEADAAEEAESPGVEAGPD